MHPEAELVEEPRVEKRPGELAAAVDQEVGRELGLGLRDGVRRFAFEERRVPPERSVERP